MHTCKCLQMLICCSDAGIWNNPSSRGKAKFTGDSWKWGLLFSALNSAHLEWIITLRGYFSKFSRVILHLREQPFIQSLTIQDFMSSRSSLNNIEPFKEAYNTTWDNTLLHLYRGTGMLMQLHKRHYAHTLWDSTSLSVRQTIPFHV